MKDQKIKTLVSMAFFTAVTFLGIQAFRIPTFRLWSGRRLFILDMYL